jgi:hypothetical protein
MSRENLEIVPRAFAFVDEFTERGKALEAAELEA